MMAHPLALQLRNLQSLVEIGVDKNTTVVPRTAHDDHRRVGCLPGPRDRRRHSGSTAGVAHRIYPVAGTRHHKHVLDVRGWIEPTSAVFLLSGITGSGQRIGRRGRRAHPRRDLVSGNRDDGVGGASPGGGSGLIGLTDRVQALGGTISVTSPTGQGTTILVELPIEGRPAAPGPP
jgi:hypothetical protein